MAGRPKAEDPRSRLIAIRVTEGEGEVLDALAALDKSTVSEIGRQSVRRAIAAALQDEHVREMVQLQRRHASRASAEVLPLAARPARDA